MRVLQKIDSHVKNSDRRKAKGVKHVEEASKAIGAITRVERRLIVLIVPITAREPQVCGGDKHGC